MRIKWSERFKVDIPDIDAEHHSLYIAAQTLQEAVGGGVDTPRLSAILQEANDHVAAHFAHEELLMRITGYPGLAWHKRQHEAAARRLEDFDERIRAGEPDAGAELVVYIATLLGDHIAVSRMMAAHLRNWDRG